MAGTKRVPIARIGAPLRITARVLELFAATEKARRARRAAACSVNVYGLCQMTCRACRTWQDAHDQLCLELSLRPWQYPALPICPRPPGTAASRDWEPSGPELALWQTLERARRAALAPAPDASIHSEGTLTAPAAE